MEPIKGAFVLTNRTRSQGVSDLRDAAGTDEAVTRGSLHAPTSEATPTIRTGRKTPPDVRNPRVDRSAEHV